MTRPGRSQKISLPIGDFGRALDIADRFNIASGQRPGLRVQKILNQALDFMQSVSADIAAGNTLEVGNVHGADTFLDKNLANKIARKKDKIAYLTGNTTIPLSKTMHSTITDIRQTFMFSSNTQAASLSIRIYQHVLDHLWRGNGFCMMDQRGHFTPLDTDRFKNYIWPDKGLKG